MPTLTPLQHLLPLALAIGLLLLAARAFPRLPCWAWLPLALPLAWPIWAYWSENVMFTRRLWLQGLTRPDGRLRRWFFRGRLTQGFVAIAALLWTALGLLPMAALLDPNHWLVLAGDVLLLSLLVGPLQRALASEVQAPAAGLVARRYPLLWANLLVLALLFFLLDYWLLGAPDTRGQSWAAVAEQAFGATAATATCPGAGWVTGILAAIQALTWHFSELVIPSLPQPLLRLGAWLLALFGAGLFGWLFSALLLGTLALAEHFSARRAPPAGPAGHDLVHTAFLYTLLVLALPYLYAVHALRRFDPGVLVEPARQVLTWTDPCRWDPTLPVLTGTLDARLQAARSEALGAADQRIAGALEALFGSAEQGVDAYLDWYFSVVGEYQRLAAAAGGDLALLMTQRLQDALFTDTGFTGWLAETEAALDQDARERLARLGEQLGSEWRQAGDHSDCVRQRLPPVPAPPLRDDLQRVGTAAISATAFTAALAAKLAGKQGVKTALALAGKAAAKPGGSIAGGGLLGVTVCSPGGLLALGCGIVLGVTTWLAVDKALVEIDEARLRPLLRNDLLAALAEQRAALQQALHQRQGALLDVGLGVLAERLGRRFIPAEQ